MFLITNCIHKKQHTNRISYIYFYIYTINYYTYTLLTYDFIIF